MPRKLVAMIILLLPATVLSGFVYAELTVVASESGVFEWPEQDAEDQNIAWSNHIETVRPVEQVPVRLGVKFGIRYSVIGKTETGTRVKLIYLTPGIIDFDGVRHDKYEIVENLKPQKTNHVIAFKFTEAYELVPGQWRMMVFEDDRLLIQKTFDLVSIE